MEKTQILYEGLGEPFLVALHDSNDEVWGLEANRNDLFRLDQKNKSLQYAGKIPGISGQTEKAFHSVVRHGKKLFYIPFWESTLVIYDEEKGIWEKVDLELREELKPIKNGERQVVNESMPGYFYGGCVYRNTLYLFPFGYRSVVSYDILKGNIVHAIDLSRTVLKEDKIVWLDDIHIALSCYCSNHVVILDLDKKKADIRTVGKSGSRFSTILKDGADCWLVVKNRLAFVKWNPDTDRQEEYTEFPTGCEIVDDRHCFDDSTAFIEGEYLYCFPASCNMAVKFHLREHVTKEIKALTSFCQDKRLERGISTFDGGVRVNDKVFLHYQLGTVLIFDQNTEEVSLCDRSVKDPKSIKQIKEDSFKYFFGLLYNEKKKNENELEQIVGEEIHGTISKLIL